MATLLVMTDCNPRGLLGYMKHIYWLQRPCGSAQGAILRHGHIAGRVRCIPLQPSQPLLVNGQRNLKPGALLWFEFGAGDEQSVPPEMR